MTKAAINHKLTSILGLKIKYGSFDNEAGKLKTTTGLRIEL